MNVAQQRRGKGHNNDGNSKNQTILVTEDHHATKACNNPDHNHHHHQQQQQQHLQHQHQHHAIVGSGTSTIEPNSLVVPNGNTSTSTTNTYTTTNISATSTNIVAVGKVRRRLFGTGPFDRYWLNVDCCGLFCAIITYGLHCYAIYTVLFILLPPWMNTDPATSTTSSQELTTNGNNTEVTQQQQQQLYSNHYLLPSLYLHQHHRHHTMSYMGILHSLLFTSVAVLAIVSHYKAMTTDPGSVPPDAQPLEMLTTTTPLLTSDANDNSTTLAASNDGNENGNSNMKQQQQQQSNNYQSTIQSYLLEPPPKLHPVKRICRRCKSYKPNRAHHCSICQRCIIKMDHHCPWINNCVGINNHKYFLLFILYTFVSCFYTLLLIIIRFASCSNSSKYHNHRLMHRMKHTNILAQQQQQQIQNLTNQQQEEQQHCFDHSVHLLYILGLLVEAILFGLFTFCMMMDQQDVVRSKMTHIDRYKGGGSDSPERLQTHTMSGFLEVFGIRPPPTVSNTTTTNLRNNKKRIMASSSSSLPNKNNYRRLIRDGRFRWDWLSPFVPVCFPSITIRDEIIGFCRPCFSHHQSNSSETSHSSSIINSNSSTTPTIISNTELVPLNASFAKNVSQPKGSNNSMLRRKLNMEEII